MRLILALLLCLLALPAMAADNFATLAKGGAGGWLNVTRPVTEADMKDRVVLLDFWTYGCINCMQVVPDLEYLEQKFGDKLLIIGVHSAKFQGEQGSDRILAAAKRFGLKHPVINDSDFAIWNSFGIQAWPSFVVLGPDGQEVARFSGEGNRTNLEKAISGVLPDKGHANAAPIANFLDQKKSGGTLSFPARLAFIEFGNDDGMILIADSGNNRILGFNDKFKQVASFDGFKNPRGVAVVNNTIYVADTGNHQIKTIDLKTKKVTVVAGTGEQGRDRSVENTPALKAALASPWDVEGLPDGRLAIAMAGLHQLWVYDPNTKTVSVLAGTGAEAIDDGPADAATLAQPSGLSVDGDTLYFVDAESSALRQLKDDQVTTLIGTGLFDFGLKDGTYPSAMMQHPQGLFAENGKVYVADTYNNAMRVYDIATKELSTVKLPNGTLSEPGDMLVVMDFAMIVDTNHHALKRIDLDKGTVETLIGGK